MFANFAKWISVHAGRPGAFLLALGAILVWIVSGPMFSFSDTWQLVINTGTTIVTFLMVFLIQNTQNREMNALHAKLDELIRATAEARNDLIDLEDQPEQVIQTVKAEISNHIKENVRDVVEENVRHAVDERMRSEKRGAAG